MCLGICFSGGFFVLVFGESFFNEKRVFFRVCRVIYVIWGGRERLDIKRGRIKID